MVELAAGVVRKYRRQLESLGYDVDALVNGARDATAARPESPRVIDTYRKGGQYLNFAIKFDRHEALTESLKRACGARWDWDAKCRYLWTRDRDDVAALRVWGAENHFAATEAAERLFDKVLGTAEARKQTPAPVVNLDDIPGLAEGRKLRDFQRQAVEFVRRHKAVIIGDEMGCGKTIEAIASIAALDLFPAVVVCPPSLVLNWKAEVNAWLPGKTVDVVKGARHKPVGADVTIMGYTMMRSIQAAGRPRWYREPTGITARIADLKPRVIVGDESHYVKNPKSNRTKGFIALARQCEYRILLTGTPITNRPIELASQLQALGRLGEWGGRMTFAQRYCAAFKGRWGWNFDGSSNLAELRDRLRRSTMIRRLKVDVLPELPPKFRARQVVALTNAADYRRAETRFLDWVAETKGNEARWRAANNETLTQMNELRRLAGVGKIEAAKAWISDFLEDSPDRQLIVFARHVEVQEAIAVEFADCAVIKGGQSKMQRDAAVRAFQAGDAKLIVCSLEAGGVGLTLHADGRCQDVAFLEYDWTPAQMKQAEDRAHRMGQDAERVTAWQLVADETIDDDMAAILRAKQLVIDAALDGNAENGKDKSIIGETIDAMVARRGRLI